MRNEVLIDHVGRPYFPGREKDMTMIRIDRYWTGVLRIRKFKREIVIKRDH